MTLSFSLDIRENRAQIFLWNTQGPEHDPLGNGNICSGRPGSVATVPFWPASQGGELERPFVGASGFILGRHGREEEGKDTDTWLLQLSA